MKDFQEFIDNINPEFYEELKEIIEDKTSSLEFPITKENAGALLAIMAGVSINASMNVLKSYHEWVNTQTSAKDE